MRKKKLCPSLTLIGLLVTASVSAQEGMRKVRIAYPSNTICCLPLFGALKWKVFEENGLQAEIIQVRSQLAYPAMSSGEVPYVAGVGPASVSATLRGMQSKAVWFATEELIYSLIARPDFHNVKDLRNKKIALTGLGWNFACRSANLPGGCRRESKKFRLHRHGGRAIIAGVGERHG